MRRKNSSPYALAPLLLLAALGVWYFASGGTGTPGRIVDSFNPFRADPSEMYEHLQAGAAALRSGDSHRAADEFQKAVASRQGSSQAYVMVGQQLMDMDLAPAAVNLLVPAAQNRDFAWDPLLWYTLADAYARADDQPKKEDSLKRAAAAAAALDATVSNHPSSPRDRAILANRLLELGDYDLVAGPGSAKGISVLRSAVALAPDDVQTLGALGLALANVGTTPAEFAEAVTTTRKALQIESAAGAPDNGALLDTYGWALYDTREYEGARRVIDQAIDAEPDRPEFHYHLAMVYQKLGQTSDAYLELDRALLLRPRFQVAVAARAALPPSPVPSATPAADAPVAPTAATPAPSASPTGTQSSAAPLISGQTIVKSAAPALHPPVMGAPPSPSPAKPALTPAKAAPSAAPTRT